MSDFNPFLKSFLTAMGMWLSNAVGGSLFLLVLMLSKASDEGGHNAEANTAGIGIVFVLSLVIGAVSLLVNIPSNILLFYAVRKLPLTLKESYRLFCLYSFCAIVTPLILLCLPFITKVIFNDALQFLLFISLEVLIAFICFIILKPSVNIFRYLLLLNLILVAILFTLVSPGMNMDDDKWKSVFIYSIFYIPGTLILFKLNKKFNLLNI